MTPTVGLQCRPVGTTGFCTEWANFCAALMMAFGLGSKKVGAMCMLAPPRPASATSLDCPDEGLSPNFGSLNLFLGPVLPASSQLALPVAFKGSFVICFGVL